MKYTGLTFAIALIVAIGSSGCQSSGGETTGEGAVIKAEIANAEGQTVMLDDINGNSAYAIDTAVVEKGKAVFGADAPAGIYRLRFPNMRSVQGPVLYLDNATRLELDFDVQDPKAFQVKGNAENELLLRTLRRQDEMAQESLIYKESINNPTDLEGRLAGQQSLDSLIKVATAEVKAAVEESKSLDPNLTAFLLNFLDPNANLAYITNELAGLREADPESKLIRQMSNRFVTAQQQQASNLAIGSMAPDIVQNDPSGNPIALSSLRGKYVLIDFWAAWCRPCRFENPNIVANYRKFNEKGFEVFGVSLDRQKEAWVKAIQDDNLIWPSHVSDLQAWNNAAARLYGVSSIPASFLIDPEGRIIARNLRGPALEQKLTEVLGN